MRWLGESSKETFDIDFRSARDDDLQPRSLCGCIGQDLQETWARFSVATLVKCVNDKDERVLRLAWKGADKIKEERSFHRLWSKVWVVVKVFCYNGSKGGKDHGEFVDESQEDVDGLAQNGVVPPAEKAPARCLCL